MHTHVLYITGQGQVQRLEEASRGGHHGRAGAGALHRQGRGAEGQVRLRREQGARGCRCLDGAGQHAGRRSGNVARCYDELICVLDGT